MQNAKIKNKTVLITGAASGIGRETARLFVEQGFFVGAVDINEQGLQMLKDELGANCITLVADIRSVEQMSDAYEKFAEATHRRLDVLVANAAILVQKYFAEGTLFEYKDVIDTNSFGTVNTIYQALPLLKQTESARIVITSSAVAVFGLPKFSVYSASKHFLRALTESLSGEFKSYGIEVSDVLPYMVYTNMTKSMTEEQFVRASTQTPQQIAKVIYKATKSKKRHHLVGPMTNLLGFAARVLPTRLVEFILKKHLKVR